MKKKRPDKSQTQALQPDSPFAGLAALKGSLPVEANSKVLGVEKTQAGLGGKIIVSKERKGRAGKTVTLIRGITLEHDQQAQFIKQVRKALGTHCEMEGDVVVVGGDMSDRLVTWLKQQGAGNVVKSGG